MTRLKAGDRVDCRIRSSNIVSAYHEYDEIRTFEILSEDDEGYYIYVPSYIYLNGGSVLEASRARRLRIPDRFVGEKIMYISDGQVYRVVYELDGMKCFRCQDFVVMAESNQPEGKFLCWACKNNPYR